MQKILIIGYTWPEPKTTAAGVRMLQLMDFFLENNFEIYCASASEKSKYAEDLSKKGITEIQIQLNDSSFDVLLKKLNPDIVVFDRFYTEEQFGWRIAEICPQALKILDTEDLHFLRKRRQDSLNHNNKSNLLKSDITKREIASIFRSDISLIISKVELEVLKNEFKVDTSLLHYIPFLVKENAVLKNSTPTFEERKNFVFIGNFKHQPNVDTVLELKTKIWPLISKQLPEAEMHCYGAYASQQVKQLHNPKERFFISGWVDDDAAVIKKAKVMLAPIRFGAGLKGKLISAMQYGTPSVSTKIGSEGISDDLQWNGFLEEDSLEFAMKAVQLYTDRKYWKKAQENGYELLFKKFNSELHKTKLIKKIKHTQENIRTHRMNNFIGSLLMHHTLQSTKYLSKWIEEKNKAKTEF